MRQSLLRLPASILCSSTPSMLMCVHRTPSVRLIAELPYRIEMSDRFFLLLRCRCSTVALSMHRGLHRSRFRDVRCLDSRLSRIPLRITTGSAGADDAATRAFLHEADDSKVRHFPFRSDGHGRARRPRADVASHIFELAVDDELWRVHTMSMEHLGVVI